ncbi:formate dehydrogenase accessory sulfurtransferase FdhD [Thalassotalea mangrovi]|uniref:Sulfur carrier protein FdhD n=1 Tax=Thalassotalea mangrovi TaxID=2572245 RepID=A0A4U1B7M2_9GAMM|nr:formate dehydrogenase accessory sulfurtransferase FdhD [Thalassotalea mangrovi]TKB46610.1 formate dehydrogenase accessory sulfurtransferase FdhD [Thalassotalea mangrovi]
MKPAIIKQSISVRDYKSAPEGSARRVVDNLVEELPVAVVYNGLTHAVMMLTPVALEHFALGFSLTEGIIDRASDIFGIEVVARNNGLELHVELNSRQFNRLKQHRRTLTGASGCGLCGKESLDMVTIERPPLTSGKLPPFALIEHSLDRFSQAQVLNQQCGSVHGCGLFTASGELLHVSEDVGRHNALDKLIGFTLSEQINIADAFVITSSRASFEMVQKCLLAKIKTLVCVSAATHMAVRLAQQGNINLVGFARHGRHVIYHQSHN